MEVRVFFFLLLVFLLVCVLFFFEARSHSPGLELLSLGITDVHQHPSWLSLSVSSHQLGTAKHHLFCDLPWGTPPYLHEALASHSFEIVVCCLCVPFPVDSGLLTRSRPLQPRFQIFCLVLRWTVLLPGFSLTWYLPGFLDLWMCCSHQIGIVFTRGSFSYFVTAYLLGFVCLGLLPVPLLPPLPTSISGSALQKFLCFERLILWLCCVGPSHLFLLSLIVTSAVSPFGVSRLLVSPI